MVEEVSEELDNSMPFEGFIIKYNLGDEFFKNRQSIVTLGQIERTLTKNRIEGEQAFRAKARSKASWASRIYTNLFLKSSSSCIFVFSGISNTFFFRDSLIFSKLSITS